MYLFVHLFVCTFSLSSVLLMNRRYLKFAVSIFLTSYVLSFKSYKFFKERTERFSVRIEKSKYTWPFFMLRH